jgi:hypothetical protein
MGSSRCRPEEYIGRLNASRTRSRISVRMVSTDDGTLNETDVLDSLELAIATGRLVAADDLAPERLAIALAASRGDRCTSVAKRLQR